MITFIFMYIVYAHPHTCSLSLTLSLPIYLSFHIYILAASPLASSGFAAIWVSGLETLFYQFVTQPLIPGKFCIEVTPLYF